MTDIYDHASDIEQLHREAAIARHQARTVPAGASQQECQNCGNKIPADRQEAAPGCTRCIQCERAEEARRNLFKR